MTLVHDLRTRTHNSWGIVWVMEFVWIGATQPWCVRIHSLMVTRPNTSRMHAQLRDRVGLKHDVPADNSSTQMH